MSKQNLNIPKHIGVIPDGNRRWARKRGQKSVEGHRAAVNIVKNIADYVHERGIGYLSVYLFSTENWKRSDQEVSELMDLIFELIDKKLEELDECQPQIQVVGFRQRLSSKIAKAIRKVEEGTKNNNGICITLCLDYGGKPEIVEAIKSMFSGDISKEDINEDLVERHLWSGKLPPIDFLIRTSGEKRLSNFMLWQAAYAELYFADVYFPDFDIEEFDKALEEFSRRQRRFGGG